MHNRRHVTISTSAAAVLAVLSVAACRPGTTQAANATVSAFSSASGSGDQGQSASQPGAAVPSSQAAPAPIPTGYDPKHDANADITAALTLAKQTHRNVVIDFGDDHCSDCTVLHQDYQNSALKPILQKNFIIVTVDIGSFDANMDISHTYRDAAKKGMPALAVLDPSGDILTTTSDGSFANARYKPLKQVVAFFDKWLPAK